MIGTILAIGWILLTLTSFIVITTALLKRNANQTSIGQTFVRQKWFWIAAGALALLQSLAGLILQPIHKAQPIPESHFAISTFNQPPPFSCSKVERFGDGWHIIGPLTIAGSVFQEDTLAPHSVQINGVDITKFIDDHCGGIK